MTPIDNAVPTCDTPSEPRLRSMPPWQATILCLAACALALPVLFVPGIAAERVARGALTEPLARGLIGGVLALLAFPGLALAIGIAPSAFFMRSPGIDALYWTTITLGLVGVLVLVAAMSDGLSVDIGPIASNAVLLRLGAALAIGVWTGIVEEVLVRGVLLSVLGHRWNWWAGIVLTALLFGALHAGAGTTDLETALHVVLTAIVGLVLGTLVVATGNVWNAIAVHATWNAAFAGYLVGFDSGTTPAPVITVPAEGSWLVGAGNVPVSASPLAIVGFAFLFIAYLWWLQPSS